MSFADESHRGSADGPMVAWPRVLRGGHTGGADVGRAGKDQEVQASWGYGKRAQEWPSGKLQEQSPRAPVQKPATDQGEKVKICKQVPVSTRIPFITGAGL